jgi:hypothetical protein
MAAQRSPARTGPPARARQSVHANPAENTTAANINPLAAVSAEPARAGDPAARGVEEEGLLTPRLISRRQIGSWRLSALSGSMHPSSSSRPTPGRRIGRWHR